VGVLGGSLWLVPTFGISRSFIVAAAVNVVVAFGAIWVARRVSAPADVSATSPAPVRDADDLALGTWGARTSGARVAVLVVIAVSGAVSLALEIIWFRVLVFFLRPTTYAFASMLATVLIGLAAGSLLVTPVLKKRANWLAVLGLLEIGVALAALVSSFLMVRSYDLMEWMWTWTWMPKPYDFVLPLMASAGMAILPTSMLLGAAFPLGLLLWTAPGQPSDAASIGGRAGTLYALNVAGAIVGSLAAGFVLLPLVGSQTSLVLVSAVPLIGGTVLLAYSRLRAWLPIALSGATAFLVIAVVLPDLFRDVIVRRYDGHEVLWHREDAQAAVSVVTDGREHALLIDGMHHASDGAGMIGQHAVIGALGLAVHPQPRRILVVGLGGGVTAGAASVLPSALTEVVELSPSVIAAAPWFERSNRHVWQNPRVRFRVDDGRNYLLRSAGRYDVITADLLLPEMAGAANLYSADYYRIARRALAPGGIMVQWLDVGQEERYRLLLRTFASVFPHVTVWQAGGIVIGSNDPLRLNRAAFDEKRSHELVRDVFDRVGLTSFEALVGAYVGAEAEIAAYVGDGPLLVDDRPTIEYFLSMPRGGPAADIGRLRGDPGRLAGVETP
jgi:spermidine synthase